MRARTHTTAPALLVAALTLPLLLTACTSGGVQDYGRGSTTPGLSPAPPATSSRPTASPHPSSATTPTAVASSTPTPKLTPIPTMTPRVLLSARLNGNDKESYAFYPRIGASTVKIQCNASVDAIAVITASDNHGASATAPKVHCSSQQRTALAFKPDGNIAKGEWTLDVRVLGTQVITTNIAVLDGDE